MNGENLTIGWGGLVAAMISVLYIDDEPGLLDLGKRFLEREQDFSVDTLDSARKALEQIRLHDYDVIVSDYLMPDMDGLTLLKNLRRSGNSVPFIMFTGRGREEVVIDAFTCGASFYLQKGGDPVVQFAELSHKIRQSVGKRRAEERLRQVQWEWEHMFNAVENPITILAPDHRVLAANRAALDAIGLEKTDVLNRKCHDLFHHRPYPPVGCPLEKMVSTRRYEAMEMEVEGLGGRYLVSCTPELDKEGNLVKVIHIGTRLPE